MYVPNPIPWSTEETLGEHLQSRGISRRQFLEFCGSLAAVLGLDSLMVPLLARALESVRRPSVVWIHPARSLSQPIAALYDRGAADEQPSSALTIRVRAPRLRGVAWSSPIVRETARR